MNKLQLVKALQDETDISKADAHAAVDIFFGDMADALVKGDRVEIRGLCSFIIKKYSDTGRKPKSGRRSR